MQYYDINIPVNGAREINVQGDYVYFLSGAAGGADTAITLRNISGSDTVILRPGQAYRLGAGAENVRWLVGNYANQATIAGVLLMGEGEFSDNRISGSVEVIDGGKSRTLAGSAYSGVVYQAAEAAKFAHAQLWNPAASGKNLIIESLYCASLTGAFYGQVRSNTGKLPLSTPNGNVVPMSKKSGGPASIGEFWTVSDALDTLPVMVLSQILTLSAQAANARDYFRFTEPYVVRPGYGFSASNGTVNSSILMGVEWYEESI